MRSFWRRYARVPGSLHGVGFGPPFGGVRYALGRWKIADGMTLATGRHAMNAKRTAINQSEITEAPTVYVVDDDVAVREMLAPLIRSAGWQPSMAASAEEFLARSQAIAPSCLLTELNLPDMTGLDL